MINNFQANLNLKNIIDFDYIHINTQKNIHKNLNANKLFLNRFVNYDLNKIMRYPSTNFLSTYITSTF